MVPTFDAELWLVHTPPGGTNSVETGAVQEVTGRGAGLRAGQVTVMAGVVTTLPNTQHQTLRFRVTGAGFVFVPVQIQTEKGLVGVIVTGTVSVRVVNGAPTTLVLAVNRQITGSDASSAASGGGTSKDIPWPKDSEVISFELPPATGAAKDLIAGHEFSLRLQVKPSLVGARGGRGGVR